jgi:hypothetical protein
LACADRKYAIDIPSTPPPIIATLQSTCSMKPSVR